MAKLVFVDFETFGMPGTPELVWQFAYGALDTSEPQFWEKVEYTSGLIDWSELSFKCISPASREFTETYTPHAFDWVTKKRESPYKLYTRKEFSRHTIDWFREQGCCPGGDYSEWSLVGRYPKFDYHCFPEVVREHIGLEPFKCQDFALMYSALCKSGRNGRLPKMDAIKDATFGNELTHHDALMDIKDEIALTLEAWKGVNRHWIDLRKES